MTFRIWLSLLLALLATGDSTRQSAGALLHDAYVWQRQWTPPVATAVDGATDVLDGVRVLAGQTDKAGRLDSVDPDWAALRRSGRPVTPVIRIEGNRISPDHDALVPAIAATLARWRSHLPLVPGIEIDHDSATSRLADYGRFLDQLRAALAGTDRLSMTALPTWLSSADLPAVLAPADEIVLQVHGVDAPERGIIDIRNATAWIEGLAKRTAKPFRVALPTYGARIARGADGTTIAIDTEISHLAGGTSFVELTVEPTAIAGLLRRLESQRPRNLVGVAWFRLPTAADRRAWSLATLRAVIRNERLDSRIAVAVAPGVTPGTMAVALVNGGATDAPLPRRLELPANCTLADGINGYALQPAAGRVALVRVDGGPLRAQRRREIGWARCALNAEEIHVDP